MPSSGLDCYIEAPTGEVGRDHWKGEKTDFMGIDIHVLSLAGEVVNLVENLSDIHTKCQKWKPGIV
jgi:hypothetical protein